MVNVKYESVLCSIAPFTALYTPRYGVYFTVFIFEASKGEVVLSQALKKNRISVHCCIITKMAAVVLTNLSPRVQQTSKCVNDIATLRVQRVFVLLQF